jgi:hypothetical protein
VRKVLLVSYTFAPQYDISARRAVKLCKYLPEAGWEPIVLTKDWNSDVADEDRRSYTLAYHPEVLDALGDVRVVRTRYRSHDNVLRRMHERLGGVYGDASTTVSANRNGDSAAPVERAARDRWAPSAVARRVLSLFSPVFGDFPDPFRGWIGDAVDAGVALVRSESVDAICSLCPPATAHAVASGIARRTGVPWVAQFDDLYSFHLERQTRAAWRPYTNARHRRWMSRASLAGAITPAMLAYVRRTYGLDGDVVVVGYDPDESPVADVAPHEDLRLAYTGSVYPGDQRPEILFDALERVVREHGSGAPPVTMVFAGSGRDDELRKMVERFPNAARSCVFIDRLPPADALRLQRESDALVLLNCTRPSRDEGTLSFPAKSFEYLNAARPILAIPRDPGGWGDQLLEQTRAGVTVDSAETAAAVLRRWIASRRSGGSLPYGGDRAEIERYSQPRQAATLARLLERAVEIRSMQAP